MSDFNFYINREGVRGRVGEKGDKGDKGFSPYIDIKTNTPTEFIMTVHNEEESFDTPNLIPTAIGEKVTELDTRVTTNEQSIEVLQTTTDALNRDLADTNSQVTAHQSRLNTLDSEVSQMQNKDTLQDGAISDLTVDVNNQAGDISALEADVSKKQNKLIQGDNITLTDNSDGTTTISSTTGAGSGDVTAAGNNTFTGQNFFTNAEGINVQNGSGYATVAKLNNEELPTDAGSTTLQHLQLGSSTTSNVLPSNTYIKKYTGDSTTGYRALRLLDERSLVAGDNVTLAKNTTTGSVTISTNAGGSPLDEFISGSTNNNTTTITAKDGKVLKLDAPTIAVGDNLVNTTEPDKMQLYLKQNDIAAGDNITIEKTATGIKVNASGGGELPENIAYKNKDNNFSVGQTIKTFGEYVPLIIQNNEYMQTKKPYLIMRGHNDTNILKVTADLSNTDLVTNVHFGVAGNSAATFSFSTGYGTLMLGNNSLTYTKTSGDVVDLLNLSGGGDETPIATTGIAGKVKPDGSSITITEDGTISATPSTPTNMVTTNTSQTITGQKHFKYNGVTSFSETGSVANSIQISPSDGSIIFNNAKANRTVKIGSRGYTNSILNIGDGLASVKISTTLYDKDGNEIIGCTGNSSTGEKYGIQGDYTTHYGIVDNPNGIIEYNATNKDIVVKQGLVLRTAGTSTGKTTIAADIPYAVTTTGDFTLFYAGGNLLECGKVDYSITEPADNGVDNYQAWFNPDITANPDKKWQFKSNDTGNVFRPVDSATPIANIKAGENGVISVSHIGYRVIDDDIFAQQSDIESIQNDMQALINEINSMDTTFIAHQAMPSARFVNLGLGASGTTYTVPADGYIFVQAEPTTAPAWLEFINTTKNYRDLSWTYSKSVSNYIFVPIGKGDSFRINMPSSTNYTAHIFRFIYAEGVMAGA